MEDCCKTDDCKCSCSEPTKDQIVVEKSKEARKHLLESAKAAVQGSKNKLPTRKNLLVAIEGLINLAEFQEEIISALLHDIMILVKNVGEADASIYQVSVSLGAVVEALKTRKLLTDEELAVAFRNLLKETSEELAKRMEETEKEIKEATSDK